MMKRFFIQLAATFFPCLLFAQEQAPEAIFREAERYYQQTAPTAESDSMAVALYLAYTRQVLPEEKNAPNLYKSWKNVAVLRQTYGRLEDGLGYYHKAVAICEQFNLPADLLFEPYLYMGNSYYSLNKLDSSLYYLTQAEEALPAQVPIRESAHLYNSLGVLYFESANYRQSINYFEKALATVGDANATPDAIIAFKSNIASSLRHLEEYDQAVAIYRSLLPLVEENEENAILINLSTTYLEQALADSAFYYLSKIADEAYYQSPVYKNKLATIYFLQGNFAEAKKTIIRYLTSEESQLATNQRYLSLNYKLLGDIYQQEADYKQALDHYQKALWHTGTNFKDPSVYANPKVMSNGFYSYNTFELLEAKAECFFGFYQKGKDQKQLLAAIDTYEAAFELATFFSKLSDNDDARLFLSEQVFPAYQRMVIFQIAAYEHFNKPIYLEQAFLWSEKSKARVLSERLQESELRNSANVDSELLTTEKRLRLQLSNLYNRIALADNRANIEYFEKQLQDTELQLSKIQTELLKNPAYRRGKFNNDSIDLPLIREKILQNEGVLLSYFHAQDSTLLAFAISADGMHFQRIEKKAAFRALLEAFLQNISNTSAGNSYSSQPGKLLYDYLLAPFKKQLSRARSLVILPHQSLSALPFEALEDEAGNFLLETHAVTYQYSAYFLQQQPPSALKLQESLFLAPFSGSFSDRIHPDFRVLPSSKAEAGLLQGKQVINREATKTRFRELAGQYSVVHMATHGLSNTSDPLQSFIAFYPVSKADSSFKLYAHEIYTMDLQKVGLAYLSACETARGKIVGSEGPMSLARAFAYAGCPNLITSLWKAEDQVSADIAQRFYGHLESGYGIAQALRQARIDFLEEPQNAQFRNPAYWANLVHIGLPEKDDHRFLSGRWLYLVGIVVLITALVVGRKLTADRKRA